jgi:ABC-2 type transport system permease protein
VSELAATPQVIAPPTDGRDPSRLDEPTPWHNFWTSLSAVTVKESRWRMRGRRAFVIVTIYAGLVALLVLAVQGMVQDAMAQQARWSGLIEEGAAPDMVSGAASVAIGQGVFGAILILQTVLTLFLAPALSSGAISSEREKQTLELLITTPASTLGLVVGKLVSSLGYVVLLTFASVPLMSLVFVYGGVAPDDVMRAYLYLLVLAFGVGSIGLVMSALFKRSQVATAVSYAVLFVLAIVTLIVHTYMLATAARDEAFFEPRAPSEVILWLNPFAANIDLMCTAVPSSGEATCRYSLLITGQEGQAMRDLIEPPRDAFWPRSALAYLLLGVALTLATTQLIAPSRRWRRQGSQPQDGADPGAQDPAGPHVDELGVRPVPTTPVR